MMELSVKDRLESLLRHLKMSQKQFASLTGVAENTISHAKKGVTPKIDFFNSIYRAFPYLNPCWLYMGIGDMIADSASTMTRVEKGMDNCMEKLRDATERIQRLNSELQDKKEIIRLLRKE